jgi:3-oxoadipate enol-lactonase
MSVEVHHVVEGPEGAPVIAFGNSLGTDTGMWDAQAAALGDRYRVVRFDSRGHGGSPAPPGPYSIADLGGDALALMDRLGYERFSFCGLSIGGMISMWLGVNAPERIEKLVICCTATSLPPREPWTERAAMVRAEGTEAVIEATMERWFTPEFRASHAERIEPIRAAFLATDPEGYAGCCEAIADFDIAAELGAVRAPTLVVGGAEDPVGTPERSRAIQAAIDGAELLELPTARHLAAVEEAEAVSAALAAHLDKEAADA